MLERFLKDKNAQLWIGHSTTFFQECDQVTPAGTTDLGLPWITIRFGQTGLKVSQLCLGTMSMGSSAWKGWVLDQQDAIPILRRALDLGISFFDMADWFIPSVAMRRSSAATSSR